MKLKFKIIITILLFIFSFYYTDKCVNILKQKDPLMKAIIKSSNEYNHMSNFYILSVYHSCRNFFTLPLNPFVCITLYLLYEDKSS